MFRIKICGVTNPQDAQAAIEAGAEAIGLNFYANSPRCVSVERAQAIVNSIRGQCEVVGVFVNSSDEEINQVGSCLQLDWVQLHGDESADLLPNIDPGFRLIRVRRLSESGLSELKTDLEACAAAGRPPEAVLVDAAIPGQYGGTGTQLDWTGLEGYSTILGTMNLVLAGGLTADNVHKAIRQVQPYAVDVASGVEESPGVKDHQKMQAFIAAAHRALRELLL